MSVLSSLTGAFVNAGGILLGGGIGLLLRRGLPERLRTAIMTALGLAVMYIGLTGCFDGQHTLVVILALVIGALLGEWLDPDRGIRRLGEWLEHKMSPGNKGKSPIAEGFVSASLLFCVGAMAVIGSLNSGLRGDHTMQFTKACLDMISSIVMASSLGAGVLLSAVSVFVLQGGITLLAHTVAPFLTEGVIADMTCVGSLLIVGLSLNLLNITKMKIMNFVPAIFLPILLCPLYDTVAGWLAGLI